MILDAFTRVSTAQAITVTAVSTSSMDLSSAGINARDIGRGRPIVLRVQVTTAFSGAGAMQIGPVLCTQSDLAGGTIHIGALLGAGATGLLLATDLPLNAAFELTVPSIPEHLLSGANGLRFLGVAYILLSGTFSTGAVTADFHQGIGGNKPRTLAKGYAGP
jgi:hypothetical protein